jgi:hypothetical protein
MLGKECQMVKRVLAVWVAVSFGLSLVGARVTRAAEEQVENPGYKSWASQKPGTTVTLETSSAVAGRTFKAEIVQRLVEVTPEEATIEVTRTINVPGAPAPRPQTVKIAAKVDKSKATPGRLPPNVKGEMKEAGTEKVTVAGKTYECKVYEFSGESNGVKSSGKSWFSAEMPGGLVKLESTANIGGNDSKTTMEVTNIETK